MSSSGTSTANCESRFFYIAPDPPPMKKRFIYGDFWTAFQLVQPLAMNICSYCRVRALPATLGSLCTSCHKGTWWPEDRERTLRGIRALVVMRTEANLERMVSK